MLFFLKSIHQSHLKMPVPGASCWLLHKESKWMLENLNYHKSYLDKHYDQVTYDQNEFE